MTGRDSASTTRRNIKSACGQCHKRKVKCDGKRPSCNGCDKMGVECSYDGKVDHRRTPNWAHVDALARRVAELEGQLQQETLWTEPVATSDPHLIRNHLGDIRSFNSCSLYHHLPPAQKNQIEDPPNLTVDYSLGFRRFLPDDVPITETQHDQILQAFDLYGNSPLGLVRMDLFTRDMREILSFTDHPSSRTDHYSPMLHNLIIALGWPLIDDSEDAEGMADRFLDYALRWYHVEVDRATLCTVTSMALLATYHAGQGSPSLGWIYLGTASAIVTAMGLTTSSTAVKGGTLDRNELADRSDSFWAFYIEDAFWALYIGRSCYLDGEGQPQYHQDDSEESLWRLQEVRLARIARRVVNFPSNKSRQILSPAEQSAINQAILDVEAWADQLPEGLQIPIHVRHVRTARPRLLLLHANACLLLMLSHRSMSVVRAEAFDRAELAALRVLALADCWDRLHGIEKCPVHLQHSLFIAGTIFVDRLSRIPVSSVTTRQHVAERVILLERYFQRIGRRLPTASQSAAMLNSLHQSS